jgi:hypothetical protein
MKKWSLGLGIPLLVLAAYYSTDAVLTARTVLPPNSGYGRIAKAVLDPPYQMARPHYSLIKNIFTGFSVQSVCASEGPPYCNQLISAPVGGSCLYCPNCQTGPCTIYICKSTSYKKSNCEFAYNTAPCTGRQDDKAKYCIV